MKTTKEKIDQRTLITLGVIQTIFTITASYVIGREANYPYYLSSYLAMGVTWIIGCYYVTEHASDTTLNLHIVIVFSVLMRGFFLPTEPSLSDDIYRYIWDGQIQQQGINPYIYSPDNTKTAFLRQQSRIYEYINNKSIQTVYPPLMQMFFLSVTTISNNLIWMKLVFVSVDMLLLFLLSRLLRSLGLSSVRVLIYGWCPLVIVEIAGSGHNDVIASLLLLAAIFAIRSKHGYTAITLLSLSGLSKMLGFILSPLFFKSVRKRALWLLPLTSFCIALPYADAGNTAFKGLMEYGMRWRANDSLFHVFLTLTNSIELSKLIATIIFISIVVGLFLANTPPLRSCYLTIGALLLLTPTVHPWYFLWIAPFLAFYTSPAWLLLTISVSLSYHAPYLSAPGQPWQEIILFKYLEYLPFFCLATTSLIRKILCKPQAFRHFLGLNSLT